MSELHDDKMGVEISISQIRKDPNYQFAVCLTAAPKFPDNGKEDKPIVAKYKGFYVTVIAANDDLGAWGWVNLNSEEKKVIGNTLMDMGVAFDEWLWCTIFQEPKDGEG